MNAPGVYCGKLVARFFSTVIREALFREILYTETRASGKVWNLSGLIDSKPSVRSLLGSLTPPPPPPTAYANVYHVRPELLRNSEREAGRSVRIDRYRTVLQSGLSIIVLPPDLSDGPRRGLVFAARAAENGEAAAKLRDRGTVTRRLLPAQIARSRENERHKGGPAYEPPV